MFSWKIAFSVLLLHLVVIAFLVTFKQMPPKRKEKLIIKTLSIPKKRVNEVEDLFAHVQALPFHEEIAPVIEQVAPVEPIPPKQESLSPPPPKKVVEKRVEVKKTEAKKKVVEKKKVSAASPKPAPKPVSKPVPQTTPKEEKISSSKKAQLASLMRKSLSELESPSKSSSSTKKAAVGKLASETLAHYTPQEVDYADEIAYLLKSSLDFPEEGEVKITLTLTREGAYTAHTLLSSTSSKNTKVLEGSMKTLSYPPFGKRFPNEKTKTFTLKFRVSP